MAKWNPETRRWEFEENELEANAEAALAEDRRKAPDATEEPVATSVDFLASERRFRVDLSNGTTYLFPADLCQGLQHASLEDLAEVRIRPGGGALHWPRLNEDYSVIALVMGIFGSERWMKQVRREIGRNAGRRKSEAKSLAARLNGRSGGKPRSVYQYAKTGGGYEVRLGELCLGRIERVGSSKAPLWQARQSGSGPFPTREAAAKALHERAKKRQVST